MKTNTEIAAKPALAVDAGSADRLRRILASTEWVLLFARALSDDEKTKQEITDILNEIRAEREDLPNIPQSATPVSVAQTL